MDAALVDSRCRSDEQVRWADALVLVPVGGRYLLTGQTGTGTVCCVGAERFWQWMQKVDVLCHTSLTPSLLAEPHLGNCQDERHTKLPLLVQYLLSTLQVRISTQRD